MYIRNGLRLPDTAVIVENDVTYFPSTWQSEEGMERFGIKIIPDPELPDTRYFYWDWENTGKPEIVVTPFSLEQAGKGIISRVTSRVVAEFAQTDWEVSRAAEPDGIPMKPATLAYRKALRAVLNDVEAAVATAKVLQALIDIEAAIIWPENPYASNTI